MMAIRVKLNGRELCVAGGEDLGVLSAIFNAVGTLGSKTKKKSEGAPELMLSVGGLTRRMRGADFHLRWVEFQKIAVGDRLEVEFVETPVADAPVSKKKADATRGKSKR